MLFSRKARLTKKNDFARMFSEGTRKKSGPLLVYRRENELDRARLGLSVPKRVGNAVVRNLIKRRCREAFRALQYDLQGVDIMLTVRSHSPLPMESYKQLIVDGITK